MSKSRDAYGLVLHGLRDRLLRGEIGPGQTLSIVDLAADFGTSITPVREALARLTGEGLLASTRRSGFVRPELDADGLRDLYDLHDCALDWALRHRTEAGLLGFDWGVRGEKVDSRTLFARIVAISHNRALMRVHDLTAQALAPVRLVEAEIIAGRGEELTAIAADFLEGRWNSLRDRLQSYHQRRRAVVAKLAAMMT